MEVRFRFAKARTKQTNILCGARIVDEFLLFLLIYLMSVIKCICAGLQGHFKNCPILTKAFSEEKVIEWRRSYNTPPPGLDDADFVEKLGKGELNKLLKSIAPQYLDHSMIQSLNTGIVRSSGPNPSRFPHTESLKQCEERAFGFWRDAIAPQVRRGRRVLIVAHANTIRALVKSLDNISDEKIAYLKIPNGIPLIYTLDENLEPMAADGSDLGFQAKYLVSARNHAKVCVYVFVHVFVHVYLSICVYLCVHGMWVCVCVCV